MCYPVPGVSGSMVICQHINYSCITTSLYHCLQKIEELQVAQEMVDESYDTLRESTQSISNDTIRDTVRVS